MLPEWLGAALDGARAALGEPLALLAVLAVALAGLNGRGCRRGTALVLFLAAALASHWLPPSLLHGAVAAALLAWLGLQAAAGWPAGAAVHAVTALAGGAAFGLAAGLPLALAAEAAGALTLASLVLVLLQFIGLQLQRRWPGHAALRLGPRILGAWIAAIGLLLMALQLWGRRG